MKNALALIGWIAGAIAGVVVLMLALSALIGGEAAGYWMIGALFVAVPAVFAYKAKTENGRTIGIVITLLVLLYTIYVGVMT